MPHMHFLDFLIWPTMRDFAVQLPTLQEYTDWMADLCDNIQCHWPFPLEDATFDNARVGKYDLTDLAKDSVLSLPSWSVGPTFRDHLPNADMYVKIRET